MSNAKTLNGILNAYIYGRMTKTEAIEAINQLLIESKIEELSWALHASHGGQQSSGELKIRRDELQQSLKDKEK